MEANKRYTRSIEDRIKQIDLSFRVLVLTGPRQTGKSTILEELKKDEMNKITLDDDALKKFAKEDPKQFIETFKPPLLIDEVQNAPELFPYIKIQVDKDKTRGQYWLSGSQAFELMKGVTESLAGRAGVIKMHSFSYKEISKNANSDPFDPEKPKPNKYINAKEAFELIYKGGMPELYDVINMDRDSFFFSYVTTYIERDVRLIKDIGNVELFKKFMRSIAIRNGTTINFSNISNEIGLSDKTIKAWTSVLVTSGIIRLLEPFSSSAIKRLTHMPKIIFMDSGLATYLAGFDSPSALQMSNEAGNFFEAYVVSEIIKDYENKGLSIDISHLRNKETDEIDLIIRKNNILYPLEIKKTSSPKKEMLKNFSFLDKTGLTIGTGGLICLYDQLYKIDEKNYVYPLSSVIG